MNIKRAGSIIEFSNFAYKNKIFRDFFGEYVNLYTTVKFLAAQLTEFAIAVDGCCGTLLPLLLLFSLRNLVTIFTKVAIICVQSVTNLHWYIDIGFRVQNVQ
jgi:hypothetical protein